MLKIFYLLFYGCVHQYEQFEWCDLTDDFGSKGTRYKLRCKKCGRITKKDLI